MTSRSRAFLVILLALCAGGSLAGQTPPGSKPLPQTYGTSAINYLEVPAAAFLPTDSFVTYNTNGVIGGRFSNNCAGLCFSAPLQLPAGAKVVYLELDYVDSDASEYVTGTLAICSYGGLNCAFHPATGGGPVDCRTVNWICSGEAFDLGQSYTPADLGAENITVDNFHNAYTLTGGACCTGNSHLGGMIVGYVLQVSPAPGAASFVDVPTNHPYFQFIEALYAAGITGGCLSAPLKYCPDRPITRGEMAVYLARALGLQFSY